MKKWGAVEKAQWFREQTIKRSYQELVVSKIDTFRSDFDVIQYGALSIDAEKYPLYCVQTKAFDKAKQNVLVTGGVHGYETSGVHGALQFIESSLPKYAKDFNFIVAPCISPWGYETVNRWNNNAVDPNRNFCDDSVSEEAAAVMKHVRSLGLDIAAHVDLHETTDTDKTVFGPAKAARDADESYCMEEEEIPDGFYLCGDSENPVPEFQKSVIDAVRKVTHIAPADKNNQIIGTNVAQEGVILYPVSSLFLCIGWAGSAFATTTEVYPDSPQCSAQQCNDAQVAAVEGALQYILQARR